MTRSQEISIFLIVLTDSLGYGINIPLFPFLISSEGGNAAFHIASSTTLFFLVQSITSPKIGQLSDVYGQRKIMLICQLGTLISLILCATFPTILTLYIARFLDGLTGGNFVIAQSYVGSLTDKTTRTRGFTILGAGYNASVFIGPIIGSLLSINFGFSIPFIVGSLIVIISMIASAFVLKNNSIQPSKLPSYQAKQLSYQKSYSNTTVSNNINWSFWKLLIISATERLSFFIFQVIWPVWISDFLLDQGYSENYSRLYTGSTLSYMGVINIVLQLSLINILIKKWGERKLIKYGLLIRAFSLMSIVFLPRIDYMLFPLGLIILSSGFLVSPITGLATLVSESSTSIGKSIGMIQSSKNIGRLLGALFSGLLYTYAGREAVMFLPAFLCVITAIIAHKFIFSFGNSN
ncbi:MAG: MFS transporter [Anaerolineae bacterium]|nr:MFS transporter [Anaerolineae bacterium]